MADKKVILITGASGALGTQIVQSFLAQNYCVIAQCNTRSIALENSTDLHPIHCDLSNEQEIITMMNTIEHNFGKLDCVINNAGVSNSSISWKTSLENWNQTIAINLTAPFLISKHAIPLLRKQQAGSIISISSVVGQIGEIGTCAYAASKSGLFGLTKTLSKELAQFNITVNCIALGYFNTGMINQLSDELQEKVIAQIPLNKLGDPESLCETIHWLLGKGGQYVTGQIINLNGGLHS